MAVLFALLQFFSIFASVKTKCLVIGIVMGIAFAACSPSVKVPEPEVAEQSRSIEGPSLELSSIDSLMWKQPESALAQLQRFAISPAADSLDAFNGHYCQLLISELLYKNDWKQSNRGELLKAVEFFDSIVDLHGADVQKRHAFLDARGHYINGVGFYEQGDVVNACEEYLKTLDVMEAHFEEKELVEHKARFLAYTYNRLGDLFSEQFMMESSITCYENALVYCKISPTSPTGVSNILYRIGKQYDKNNEIENASLYYGQALENMAATDNLVYRNIVASKALCDYEMEGNAKQALEELNHALFQAKTENERLNRFLTIGGVYFLEGNYDSALFYLEPVFEDNEAGLQAQAAGYLRIIYDSIGNKEQSDAYMRFLTNHKKPEGENKALVSTLEDMYKNYSNHKLEKQAEAERKIAEKRVMNTIIPIAIAVALAIFCVLILRSRKLLKNQKEESDREFGEAEKEHEKELRLWQTEADRTLEEMEKKYEEELEQLKAETKQHLDEAEKKHLQWMADAEERHSKELRVQKDRSEKELEKTKTRHEKELEAERLAYEKEQDTLRQNLMERVAQVRALEEALNIQREEAKLRRMAFLKEPICQSIRNKLSGKNITTRENAYELGIALKDEDFEQLREAVEKHYNGFDHVLLSQCPGLKHGHLALCHLYLLGINESEIAVLKNVSYSAIKKQNESLQEKLGVEENVAKYVMRVAEGLVGHAHNELKLDLLHGSQGSSQKSSQKNSQKIVNLIKERPEITTTEMAEIIGLTRRSIVNITNRLQEDGVIRRVGPDKGGRWEVID